VAVRRTCTNGVNGTYVLMRVPGLSEGDRDGMMHLDLLSKDKDGQVSDQELHVLKEERR
jgi:hypothetical protein